MSMPPNSDLTAGTLLEPLCFAGRGTVADYASRPPPRRAARQLGVSREERPGRLKPATWLRPAYALARIAALTVSKIWSMWLRSQINGGENSNVSIAMRTIRPRS